jgi:hypothetical protein
VPKWADEDGIISLTVGTPGLTIAQRVRERLREQEGELGVQRREALLQELTTLSLEEWIRKSFFPRHVRQFKYRPVAWHLTSRPPGKQSAKPGVFECMLYYHACNTDALARIRTKYVEPMISTGRTRAVEERQAGNDTAAGISAERVQELEDFAERLRGVEESGFTSKDLEKFSAVEPLDRWAGDGYLPPPSREEFERQEHAWNADINDGVRVNIAPLQLAGLLAADVLKKPDAVKAISDRVRWRADERGWVREGKLPRCGWMPEDVPESPRWTDLAPEREAERERLERKRREALAELERVEA